MNRVFKNKWSAAHQQYVVTDEHRSTKGKASKSAVALAVAAVAMMAAGGASAAYVPSYMTDDLATFLGDNLAKHETAEYKADWGLTAMNASTAYALGYTGKGAHLGVMDSGALLSHSAYGDDGRITGTTVSGKYGSDGYRYPQSAWDKKFGEETTVDELCNKYSSQEDFKVTGDWMKGVNDSHGTHVTGTVGGAKDDYEMHGVAYDSTVVVGNTGATDNNNYGPYQDHDYFKAGWDAIVTKINEQNTADGNANRGGVINNSWGTNIRIWLEDGKNVAYGDFDSEKATLDKDGKRKYTIGHIQTNTWQEAEYEYFYFQNVYNGTGGEASFEKSFVDAAWEAIKGTNIVQVFTTGNRDSANPFYRPLYPYFNPEAESQWVAVAGIQEKGDGKYGLVETFNEAGLGKWWTVSAPGYYIYSSKVDSEGNESYGNSSGTSMAAPHVTGAMGVLMSRYPDMTAPQVRDVMFTTANHKNPDGTNMSGWDNVDGTTPLNGQVSDRMGWGMPDLAKGMFGPGQFLGAFEYDMAKQKLDVWSNDITNVALDQRLAEDQKWIDEIYTKHKDDATAEAFVLGDGFTIVVPEGEMEKTQIALDDAKKWRQYYFELRKAAIDEKLDSGNNTGYKGSLVKKGAGTLVMTGSNSYKGTTKVEAGTLLAFAESVGTDDTVTVSGGTFGVLAGYYDDFTMTGYKQSTEAQAGKLTIDLSSGDGTLHVSAAADVKVKEVKLGTGKKVSIGLEGADAAQLAKAYQNDEEVAGTFSVAEGDLSGATIADATLESVFFEKASGKLSADNKSITTTVTRKADVGFESFATTDNERAIARALEQSGNAFAGTVLSLGTKEEVNATYAALSDDMYAAARNALVVNATAVSRTVMDQARGFGEGRAAELEHGRGRIWATGIGFWGDAEGESRGLDVDFRAGLLGGEVVAHETTKLGAFFGYGSTDYKGHFGKIDGDDLHFGVYGLTDVGPVSFAYGVAYTAEDRESSHVLGTTANSHDEDATVLQAYAEAAYRFDVAGAKIDPYLGFTWARVEVDGFSEAMSGESFSVKDQKDDIQIATLGARATLPLTWGTMPVALKADLGWSHYFGDTEAVTRMQLGAGGAIAELQAKELKDQVNLGLGITGQVSQNATVGVSYTGSFGTDADTHGLTATFRYAF